MQCWAEGIIASLNPLAVLLSTQEGAGGSLPCQGMLLAHVYLAVFQDTQAQFRQLLTRQSVPACIIARRYSSSRARLHIFPSWISWGSHWPIFPGHLGLFDTQIQGINWSHVPGVTQKLKSALCHLLQVTDRELNRTGPCVLSYSTSYQPPLTANLWDKFSKPFWVFSTCPVIHPDHNVLDSVLVLGYEYWYKYQIHKGQQ